MPVRLLDFAGEHTAIATVDECFLEKLQYPCAAGHNETSLQMSLSHETTYPAIWPAFKASSIHYRSRDACRSKRIGQMYIGRQGIMLGPKTFRASQATPL